MPEYVYVLQELSKVTDGGKKILDEISLAFLPGAKIGVLGANGAGKSSLLRIFAGADHDHLGLAQPAKNIRIGFLPQEPQLDSAKTVRENIEEGVCETRALLAEFEDVSARFAEPMDAEEMEGLLERQSKLQDRIDAANAWELDREVEMAMDALRVPPGETDVTTISGGERRRVALCRLLLSKPDMLLLDEPTNHLDAESVAWLERFLDEYPGTVLAVTHDRYFLDNVAGWILELDRGRGIPYQGNYSSWLEQKQRRLDLEGKKQEQRRRRLERELEWVRASARARQAKGKARLKSYEELLAQPAPEQVESGTIYIPPGPRLGEFVVRVRDLCKGYGDRLLIEGLGFEVPPGAVVGIIGPNGAGKTSLLRMLVGHEKPDSGTIELGPTVKLAYVDQSRDALDGSKTVWEEISGGQQSILLGKKEVASRAYCSWFSLRGEEQQKKVGILSGGERNRVHLAKLLRSGANLLLLDEPTNDLDVDTLRSLEDGLMGFAGSVFVVSHDRWFLDRLATHMLAFEGDSKVVWFEGNYQAYEEDRRKRLGEEALQPRRIKYRRLMA